MTSGRRSQCRPCHNDTQRDAVRKWHRKHRADRSEYYAKWRKENAEYKRQKDLEYYRANYQANKERYLGHWRKRRARIIGTGGVVTDSDWSEVRAYFGECCGYCGKQAKLTQDHLIPLSACGENFITNIVPACGFCNSSKGHRSLLEWIWRQA